MTTTSVASRGRSLRRALTTLVAGASSVLALASVQAGDAQAAAASIDAPTTGLAGGLVQLSGSDWPAYASVNVYLVRGASSFMCALHADSFGVAPAQTCAVPTYLVAGTYTVHADDTHGHTADAAAPLTIKPTATVLSTYNNQVTPTVASGSTLSVGGHGFAASSAVTVKLGTTTVATTPAAPVTDSNGTFSGVVFTVPTNTAAGPLVVKALDATGNSATYQVTVYKPKITSAASGPAAELTTLGGTGWPAGHSVNAYVVDGTTNAFMCAVHADSGGVLPTQSCTVPGYLRAHDDTLVLTDGFVTRSAPFSVTPSISPTSTFNNQPTTEVAAGSTVSLAGHGFAPSSPLVVKLGAQTLTTSPAAPTSDTSGTFGSVVATIPAAQAAGPATLKVTDGAGNSRTYKLAVSRVTVTAPNTGAAGSTQILGGTGWDPQSSVPAYVAVGASRNFICTLHADDTGTLAPQGCTIPNYLPAGADSIVLSDGFLTTSKNFTMKSAISVTSGGQPLAGAPSGTAVTLVGFGFTASSTVSAKLGTKVLNLVPSTPSTSTAGGFSGVTFAVPNMAAGTYSLVVTDAAGKSATAQFSVS